MVTLALSSLLCSSCAHTDLADYPAHLWPERAVGSNCARMSGTYQDHTDDVWPTQAMRGSKAKDGSSLAQQLAEVSTTSRPQDFLAVERVEIDVAKMQIRLFGIPNDVASLSDWTCNAEGSLVASIKRGASGEHSFNAKVELRYELRLAVDRSLILHAFEDFSASLSGTLLRETWYRFPPAESVPGPASK